MLEKTYKIQTPSEEALPWDKDEKIILEEWTELLNREAPPNEPEMQAFFERHPSMIPGSHNLLGGDSGHFPWYASLISQPPLPSYNKRVPDFMWLSLSSDTEQPVLVEIEAPSKKWFTKKGYPTAELTQALSQIAEWKAWLNVPHNVEAFKSFYGLDRENFRRRRFRPAFLLIYGRRSEANRDPQQTQKRSHLHADDVISMTYDRLNPKHKAKNYCCIKAVGSMDFRAISVPATLKWSPVYARTRSYIKGIKKAIDSNTYISEHRKKFLISRREYWDKWALHEKNSCYSPADEE